MSVNISLVEIIKSKAILLIYMSKNIGRNKIIKKYAILLI
jgi:hypothetical protein